jgi:hypothetical protein
MAHTMRTHVEFRSDKFPAYEGEQDEITPDLWGKRLAEYLKQRLSDAGIETGTPVPEDWGWCLPVENKVFAMWIGCGHLQDHPNSYLCFVEPSKPVIRKWFKKIDTTGPVQRVVDKLNGILTSDPEITDVRWWDGTEA